MVVVAPPLFEPVEVLLEDVVAPPRPPPTFVPVELPLEEDVVPVVVWDIADEDWYSIMDTFFKQKVADIEDIEERKHEEAAREEKNKALNILSQNKISALVGAAGTGKTSIIGFLLSCDEIKDEDILLLAPTGKARVRLEESTKDLNLKAQTIAQFLSKSKRYDWKTFRYKMLGKTEEKSYGTVIIDEASMLTLDMMAALFECIKKSRRIILVGDTRQLPPIGAGRPFVDICNRGIFIKSVFISVAVKPFAYIS